ncbi:MAG: helix-turn-helix transcriptional regulator [Acetatifactor sp.]|nr:helix-turn-helix transcriptional regulator [Acetatifactor sp.]
MTIGERIKSERKKAGLTQEKLAKNSGLATITIQQYESGKRQPRLEQLRKIATTLQIPLADILPFDDGLRLWKEELKEKSDKQTPKQDKPELANNEDPSTLPHFTTSTNNEYLVHVNINRNHPLNIALKKLDNGEPLTQEESQIIKEYINSGIFREKLAQLPARFKKLADSIKRNYDLLNAEGQKEADRQMELANKQIELLTKIPEYRKKQDDTE